MYAIIKSGSRQYRVRPESIIEVNRLHLEEGAAFETDQVLLVDQDDQDIQIGSPYVSGAKVKGKVLSHLRGRKVIVFKFKRRKNYKRTRGHRQELTKVLIEGIEIGGKAVGAKKPAAAKATEKTAEKTAEKSTEKSTEKVAAAPQDQAAPQDGKQAKDAAKAKAGAKDEK
ncbi:MAG: 50S ribosomal protein L21 [SAR324 cluster bacterium]|nr:50S ribosomal protein L21 [SAR324 cluster bacterium]